VVRRYERHRGATATSADGCGNDNVMVFNGDVVSGLDLPALLWRPTPRTRADVTASGEVADPRACGSVDDRPDGRVQAFLEKTDIRRRIRIKRRVLRLRPPYWSASGRGVVSVRTGRPFRAAAATPGLRARRLD